MAEQEPGQESGPENQPEAQEPISPEVQAARDLAAERQRAINQRDQIKAATRREGFWSKFTRRWTESKTAKSWSERKAREAEFEEIYANPPKSPEELVDRVHQASFSQERRYQIEQKYGAGYFGKLKAFFAGEYDFSIGESDEIQRTKWNQVSESGRRVLMTLFNRRTIGATGGALILGALTGGVGAIPAGVILGSAAGRGLAEAYGAVYEGRHRFQVLQAEKARWSELKNLANQSSETPADDADKKFELLSKITNIYYKQGEDEVTKDLVKTEEKFATAQEKLNKVRARAQLAGEILGAGAGVAAGFLHGRFAAIDIDLWNKVPGQQIAHEIIRTENGWQFAYGQAKGLLTAGLEPGKALSQQALHALSEPLWKIGLAAFAERGASVIATAWLASLGAQIGEKKIKAGLRARYQEEQVEEREKVERKLAKPEVWTPEKLAKKAEKLGVPMPEGPDELKDWTQNKGEKLARYFSADEKGNIQKDDLFKWCELDENSKIKKGPKGFPYFARIIRVDTDLNQLWAILRYPTEKPGETEFRPKLFKINQFLDKYRFRIEPETRRGLERQEEQGGGGERIRSRPRRRRPES